MSEDRGGDKVPSRKPSKNRNRYFPTAEEVRAGLPLLITSQQLVEVNHNAVLHGIAGGAIDVAWGTEDTNPSAILSPHFDRIYQRAQWNSWCFRSGLNQLARGLARTRRSRDGESALSASHAKSR